MTFRLKITKGGFLEGFQIGSIVVLGKDEASVSVGEGGNATGILPYVPEVGIIQPQ